MGWRDFIKTNQVDYVNNEDKAAAELPQNPLSSHCNHKIISKDNQEFFEERAAIREFDGGQTRLEAELAAIEEVMPYLDKDNVLHIDSRNSPKKYRDGSQSLEVTLRELNASEETIRRYVPDKTGGTPKPNRGEE